MKIISSFYDYYDKTVAYGFDPKRVYIRETKEVEINPSQSDYNNELLKMAREMPLFRSITGYEFTKQNGIIAFCGKAYPWHQVSINRGSNKFNKTYYSIDSLEQDIMSEAFEVNVSNRLVVSNTNTDRAFFRDAIKHLRTDLDYMFNGPPRQYWTSNPVKVAEFDKNNIKKQLSDELFIKYNVPIILVFSDAFNRNPNKLILNPRLNEYGFISQFDPIAAYQEISMFIGSNLARQVDPSVNHSDDVKLNAAGFDKWSFRKHKKDPK